MTTLRRTLTRAAATAALLPVAVAGAQDPGAPPDPGAAPLSVTLKVQKSATVKQLKKGITATVMCDRACDYRYSLAGRRGIIEDGSGAATGAAKRFKVKVAPVFANALDEGEVYTLTVTARTDDGAVQNASRKVRVK